MTSFAVAFLLSMAVAAFLTPLVLRFALKRELYDVPGERKVHQHPIPRLGGIAIVVAFYVPVTGLLVVDAGASYHLTQDTSHVIGLFVGGLMIAAIGIFDDIKGANAKQKLLVQVIVAVVMFALDYRIEAISNPFGGGKFELGFLAFPVTVAWFVGVINAVNLIDGLDGLAGGIGLISVSTLFTLALMDGNVLPALFCACLGGALVGFLFFNFNPARIFMGDTGSLFLGFVLAAFSISSSYKGSTTVALAIPILALGLPILDTFLAIGRRMRRQRPIFSADQDHIHHKLLRAGLSHRQAVLAMYLAAAVLGGVGLLLRAMNNPSSGLIILVVAVLVFVFLRLLAKRNPDIEGLGDPFEDNDRLDRAQIRAFARRVDEGPNGLLLADILDELAEATNVVALTVSSGSTLLYAVSREFSAKSVIKGMKTYRIGLDGPDGIETQLAMQFIDRGRRTDLATVIPWEVVASPLERALERMGHKPLRPHFQIENAALKPFLAIPGIVFSDAPFIPPS
ncbi:MAG: UDP-GlcNAc:undecaprenyl-phosphate GlcNAc-1-phosphate transferase [Myxococcota bacterium]|jgi:UDP-GlcNAc:undecaprenyl-phosphate GlcNAc-1-phosphate transferase